MPRLRNFEHIKQAQWTEPDNHIALKTKRVLCEHAPPMCPASTLLRTSQQAYRQHETPRETTSHELGSELAGSC
eukprot:4787659-Pleurochrysis_carterae.AAC.1